MKIIKIRQPEKVMRSFWKLSVCMDDQPNFETTRDITDEGQVFYGNPEEQPKKKKRKKKLKTNPEENKQQFSDRVRPYNYIPEVFPKGSL